MSNTTVPISGHAPEGDKEKFTRLFQTYYPGLMSFAKSKLHNRQHDAEDIVANVFKKCWEKIKDLHETNIKSFLYTSTNNACINLGKANSLHNKRKRQRENEIARFTMALQSEGADDNLVRSEVRKRIYDAIALLPDGCREIFWLLEIEGLTPQEVSEKLKTSLNNVKAQKSIAKGKLRQSLIDLLPHLLLLLAGIQLFLKNISWIALTSGIGYLLYQVQ